MMPDVPPHATLGDAQNSNSPAVSAVAVKPTAICVLGMHRSGTSAVARLLNLLGVDLGDDLLPGREDNPRGFWEDRAILGLHEDLLETLGSSHEDYFPLPENWHRRPDVFPFRDRLIEMIRERFGTQRLWGFKDPRTCRLVPLWLDVFEAIGVESRFVLVVRSPDEIARSLAARDGFAVNKSLLLTITHLLEAESATRGMPRAVVTFDQVLSDWKQVADRVGDALEIQWPRKSNEIDSAVIDFLDPKLRHHSNKELLPQSEEFDPTIARWAIQTHDIFAAAASGSAVDSDALDRIRANFDAERARLGGWREKSSFIRKFIKVEAWGKNLDSAYRQLRQENNWLKLGLSRLGCDPSALLATMIAEIDLPDEKLSASSNGDGFAEDMHVAAVLRELAQAQVTVAQLSQKVAELSQLKEMSDRRLAWLDQHVPSLEMHIDELARSRDWLAEQKALASAAAVEKDEVIARLQAFTEELEKGRQWLLEENQKVNTEVTQRDDQLKSLRTWVDELDLGRRWLLQENKKLTLQLAENRNLSAQELEKAKAELRSLQAWVNELQTGHDWLNSERAKLANWAGELEASRRELQQRLDRRESEIQSMQNWTRELGDAKQWLSEQFEAAKTEVANYRSMAEELKKWTTELEGARNWLLGQRDILIAELKRREEVIAALQAKKNGKGPKPAK